MITAQQQVQLMRLASRLAISYYHWRDEGFPVEHAYHQQVAYFDYYLTTLR